MQSYELSFDVQGYDVTLFANVTDYRPGMPASMGTYNRKTGNLIDAGYPEEYPEVDFYLSFKPEGRYIDWLQDFVDVSDIEERIIEEMKNEFE